MNSNTKYSSFVLTVIAGLIAGLIPLIPYVHFIVGLVFSSLAQLPLLLVGLSLGSALCAAASIPAVLLPMLLISPLAGVEAGVLTVLPVVFFCKQSLRWRKGINGKRWWYPETSILTLITSIGIISGVILWGVQPQDPYLEEALFKVFSTYSVDEIKKVVKLILQMQPGLSSLSSLLFLFMNAALANNLLLKFNAVIRSDFDIVKVKLTPFCQWLSFTGLAILFIAPNAAIGLIFFLVGLFPLVINGFAVFHWLSRARQSEYILVIIYGLVLFFAWLLLAVAIIGIIDSWFGLRRTQIGG